MSDSGLLCVNITNDRSKTDSGDSDGSTKTNKSKSAVPPETELDTKSPVKDSNQQENSISTKDNEPESNNLPADPEASPLLWNSDCENTESNEKSNALVECNPLKRKLSYCLGNTTTKNQRKKIFCESGKEMKSKFRRSGNKWNAKRNQKKAIPFDKTNKFNRYLSNSDDSDSSINNNTNKSFNSNGSKKSRKNNDSDDDKINTLRLKSPSENIRRSPPSLPRKSIDRFGTSPSRNNYKSSSRSPLCYRRRSYSSYRSLSGFHRSPSHSRRSKSRHKTPAKGRDYELRRSISRSYSPSYPSRSVRSPSRSRRSRSRPYRSPSRSRRSKSRPYESPSRSRRSKSRTYKSPSRSRRSKSRPYESPSRSRRSKSRSYKSPSRSRRSKSRTYRSPSRSQRCKSLRGSSRRRSNSRSPSEIRAARKCSPLEDMRQQLRKNNEAAVEQALGGLEKPKKNGAARIIDDVDLTKSPSPEISAKFDRNAPTASAVRAVVPQSERPLHPYNATALHQNYSTFLHSSAGLRITGQSIAENRGLKVGDIITEINNQKTNNLCHNEAQRFIADGGNLLKFIVLRGSSPAIPPALTPVRGMNDQPGNDKNAEENEENTVNSENEQISDTKEISETDCERNDLEEGAENESENITSEEGSNDNSAGNIESEQQNENSPPNNEEGEETSSKCDDEIDPKVVEEIEETDENAELDNEYDENTEETTQLDDDQEDQPKRRPACPLTPLPRPVVLPGVEFGENRKMLTMKSSSLKL
ncbi:hypothetical protein U1Q18_043263 [Sarracenia purpurea var. burkii]